HADWAQACRGPGQERGLRVRQPVERLGVGALLGALLPDRNPVSDLRCRGDFSLSVGGRAALPGNVRLCRGVDLHRDSWRRAALRLAARRARLGLTEIDAD